MKIRKIPIFMGMTMVVGMTVLCSQVFASMVTYTDVEGTVGLTIQAVDTSQCGGTPPAVTIDGGATKFAFTDAGDGIYWRNLGEGHYHIFEGSGGSPDWVAACYVSSDSSLDLIATISANSWVTNARMADNAVGAAEIIANSITVNDIGTGAVGADEILNASVGWADLGTSLAGSSPNTNYDLDEMQDSIAYYRDKLNEVKGSWQVSTDYDMNELDSLMKGMVLDLNFSAPCTVRLTISSQLHGVQASWSMNTEHNDSSVARYEVWKSYTDPIFPVNGELSDWNYLTLCAQMQLVQNFEHPRLWGGRCMVDAYARIWVVVVAQDWQGTRWVSSDGDEVPEETDYGSISSLLGKPGYISGQSLTDFVGSLAKDISVLQWQTTEGSSPKIVVYTDHVYAASGFGQAISWPSKGPVYYSFVGADRERKIGGSFRKVPGYTKLQLYCQVKFQSINEAGSIYFNADGYGNGTMILGGTGTAADTNWAMVNHYYDVSDIASDSTAFFAIGMQATSPVDSMYMRAVVVTLGP